MTKIVDKLQEFAQPISEEVARKAPNWKRFVDEESVVPRLLKPQAEFYSAFVQNKYRPEIMPLGQKLKTIKARVVRINAAS